MQDAKSAEEGLGVWLKKEKIFLIQTVTEIL